MEGRWQGRWRGTGAQEWGAGKNTKRKEEEGEEAEEDCGANIHALCSLDDDQIKNSQGPVFHAMNGAKAFGLLISPMDGLSSVWSYPQVCLPK